MNAATKITARALHSLTSTKTGKPMYTASIRHNEYFGEQIVLTGPRGAEYASMRNIHDGIHRFCEVPAKSYTFRLVDGVISMVSECL